MKPNILLITADQWRGDCLSAVGHPVVRTPNIDALAAEGVLFRRHYAGAAPCSPARASLYTGLYQMNHRVCRNGSPLDARFDNIALAARRAGYDPTVFGYTDVSPDPRPLDPNDPVLTSYEGVLPGFTIGQILLEHERHWLGWLRTKGHIDAVDRSVHRTASPGNSRVGNDSPAYSKDETQTAFVAQAFLNWRETQDRPWFAHISFLRPHPPFCVPEPYNSMFASGDGPAYARADSRAEETAIHPFTRYAMGGLQKSSFVHGATGPLSEWREEDFDRIRAIYFGMIAEVDSQIGRVFDALRARGDWENTIVIFTSDHGEMMGDHWALGKGGYHDGSYHIPLVIRDPAATASAGKQIEAFTAAADIMPTLCERLGLVPRNHQDGASLMPFLRGDQPGRWRDAAFFEFDFREVATGAAEKHFDLPSNLCNLSVIRDQSFKYVHFAGLPPLLFDLERDPMELYDVAGEPDYAVTRLHYAEKLLTLRAAHLDQTLAYTELTEAGPVSRPRR
ncbi:alkaline phosphatase family protein [Rhizobium daejeonense]|uniref:Alkaline phosphatase family protein n=1 Tax=Rhizobium daejeonense TaxID=240521 RepID=A0A6M1S791_9HYPH|nr:alkaline phosphatase family protein [Rhizobium daejeonense]NGO65090.1 alkaline phosphatase family protein [Rhizobium daejeonense]